MSTSASPAAVTKPRAMPTWLIVTIAGLFGLFYAYFVWNAIDYSVLLSHGERPLNGYGWFVLVFAAVAPVIAFSAAFAIGWRRSWWEFSLVKMTGLALVAVFWLDILAYTTGPAGASMLG